MAYYRTCPSCGGNLDPGERCECQDKRKKPVSEALTIAAELMADMGCCIHDPGYQCGKEVPNACPACIRNWLTQKGKERLGVGV